MNSFPCLSYRIALSAQPRRGSSWLYNPGSSSIFHIAPYRSMSRLVLALRSATARAASEKSTLHICLLRAFLLFQISGPMRSALRLGFAGVLLYVSFGRPSLYRRGLLALFNRGGDSALHTIHRPAPPLMRSALTHSTDASTPDLPSGGCGTVLRRGQSEWGCLERGPSHGAPRSYA